VVRRIGTLIRSLTRTAGSQAPATLQIEHDGVRHPVLVKRVGTARRFTLRVRAARGDVVLTMPTRASLKAAQAFATLHAGWVAERIERARKPIPFAPGQLIPVRGVLHRLEWKPGLRRRVWLEGDGAPPLLCVSGPASTVAQAVGVFLRAEARHDLLQAVSIHAAAVQRPVTGLTLRDTRSRWGSCTARGSLNFSWRLVLAPPGVLDYLAAHEVAHLVHMNHSDAFWALTRRLAPQMDEAERWLKQHGPGLHGYGA
jgi:predicted metal-dependent hydrolase